MNFGAAIVAAAFFLVIIVVLHSLQSVDQSTSSMPLEPSHSFTALAPSEEDVFSKCKTICPPNGIVSARGDKTPRPQKYLGNTISTQEVRGCIYECPKRAGAFGKYKDHSRCKTPNNAGSPTQGVCLDGLCITINGGLADYPFPKECRKGANYITIVSKSTMFAIKD